MPDFGFILLVFAPAFVGLLVTLLRRTPPMVYWASVGGSTILALVILGRHWLQVGSPEIGPYVFGLVFVGIPALVAACAGRLVVLDRGGAWVFTAASSAYLFGLGLASALAVLSRVFTP